MSFFKVVATMEKNGIYFSSVPQHWEHEKILRWPSHLTRSNRELLRQNPESKPEQNWDEFPCIVKCSNINDFKVALGIEKQFSQCDDTEAEDELFKTIQVTEKHKHATEKSCEHELIVNENTINTNSSSQSSNQLLIADRNDLIFPAGKSSSSNIISNSFLESALNNIEIIEDSSMSDEKKFEHPNNTGAVIMLDDVLNTILKEISDMKEKHNAALDKLKEQYVKINVNLERILIGFEGNNFAANRPLADVTSKPKDLVEKFKFPRSTCADIEILNVELKSTQGLKEQMVNVFSQICGRSGVGEGIKAAYKISDAIFSPNILTEFTWTGVTRGTSGGKKPFQKYENIVEFFSEVLHLADNHFMLLKTKTMFKENLLKHAKKRSERKRPSNLSIVTEVMNETTENAESHVDLDSPDGT